MRNYLIIAFLAFPALTGCLTGQTAVSPAALTTIVGEVTDAQTGEPIEGVSVYFRGTPYGTSTTKEGVFLLRAPLEKKAVMVVSAVGYKPQRFSVNAGQQAGIDVQLKEESASLEEVFVLPGSNPALALLDSVRAHSSEWRNATDTKNDAVTQVDVSVSDIRATHLRRRLWKNMRSSLVPAVSADSSETTPHDTTYLLPLYSSSNVYADDGGSDKDGVWKVFLHDTDRRADFYRSTVSYCGTAFLSPVASNSHRYYTFLLADSVYQGDDDPVGMEKRKTYEVQFRTRNPYYATFNGRLLIDSATYALRRVEADVPPETNVNYLRSLHIEQDFSVGEAGCILRREQVTEILDVAVKADTTHIFPTLLIQSSYRLPAAYTNASPPDGRTAAGIHPAGRQPLVTDNMPVPPLVRTGYRLAQIALTGYIPTGTAVDFGKVPDILRVNKRETVRLGLPLRTNARMSERVCLEAYAAYGFGDREWKGGGAVHYQLPSQRRHILSLHYADDYAASDADGFTRMKMENNAWYQDRSLTTHWTEPFYRDAVQQPVDVRRREIRLSAENDWIQGVESYAHLAFGWEEGFRWSQAGLTVRLGWHERKVDLFFRRIHVYNHLPVVYLNGEMGSVHHADRQQTAETQSAGYDMYGKLRLIVRQRVNLGTAGRLDYLAEAGWLFGSVPRSMGFVFAGNDSYAFDPYCFTLMHRGQFSAQRYISLQAEWNGRGCLFNRIPWVQRLRLRELAVCKAAYGGDLSVPYVEVGVGIGNILRIANLYSVFRVTRLNDTSSPWLGIRFRFYVEE